MCFRLAVSDTSSQGLIPACTDLRLIPPFKVWSVLLLGREKLWKHRKKVVKHAKCFRSLNNSPVQRGNIVRFCHCCGAVAINNITYTSLLLCLHFRLQVAFSFIKNKTILSRVFRRLLSPTNKNQMLGSSMTYEPIPERKLRKRLDVTGWESSISSV